MGHVDRINSPEQLKKQRESHFLVVGLFLDHRR